MEVAYTPSFLRSLKKLPVLFQEEVFDKIDLFRNPSNHKKLKVHKLSGSLHGRYSFSANYKICIVFRFVGKPKEALLLAIGDHDVYQN
jgi:mRNA-degrading endonuclease YafQ of YafQ-DinJ toxin-antitoxin module